MAVLSTPQRKKLPPSDFGLPAKRGAIGKDGKPTNKAGEGAYPMPDKKHAIAAKAYATIEHNKGKLSAADKAKVDAKANKIIKRDGPRIEAHTDGKDTHWNARKESAFQAARKKR